MQALHDLWSDKDLVILAADKGNAAAVILDSTAHETKMNECLISSAHKLLNKDPSDKTESLIKAAQLPAEVEKTSIYAYCQTTSLT